MENKHTCFTPCEICGALHIHTTFSDGGVNYPELVAAAKHVGLDFIAVNDHMSLEAKQMKEGFWDNLAVFTGYEHNDMHNLNHYLVFGIDKVVPQQDSAQEYINEVKARGGIGFLAHPLERRHYFKRYPPFPWTDWNAEGYDGIEMWNQMSEWVESLKRWCSFFRVLYPRRFLKEIPAELAVKWDNLNRKRFVSGIGGVDAHSWKVKIGPFHVKIFPIKVELKGIRTHLYLDNKLLPDNWAKTQKMFLTALKDGHGFFSNYRRGDARGARIYMRLANGTCIPPGRPKCTINPPSQLNVQIPRGTEIRLIRNGKIIERSKSEKAEFALRNRGIYRIEVFVDKKAWIYSNPFPLGSYPFYYDDV